MSYSTQEYNGVFSFQGPQYAGREYAVNLSHTYGGSSQSPGSHEHFFFSDRITLTNKNTGQKVTVEFSGDITRLRISGKETAQDNYSNLKVELIEAIRA